MSDQFTLKINLNLNLQIQNEKLIYQSFQILQEYIIEENNHEKILTGISQINPILNFIIKKSDINLEFLDQDNFHTLYTKVKLFSSYPESKDFLNLIDSENNVINFINNKLNKYFKDNDIKLEQFL